MNHEEKGRDINKLQKRGFTGEGNWYKGNLHSHTTNSDGLLTPEESVALFKAKGYHFLCLSEHDLYTDYREQFNEENFIILPGLEASAVLYEEDNESIRKKVHHMHGILGTKDMQQTATGPLFQHMEVYPMRKYYKTWEGANVAQELAEDLRKRGCIITYNHPIWSRVQGKEFINTQGVWALEIYNYNTVNESNTGYDVTYWDEMLRQGKRINAIATDDNHNEGIFDDAFGGYIVVQAKALTHDAIIENMIAGNYYSSSGPEIFDWGMKDGEVYVYCSEVYRIDFIVGNTVNDGISYIAKGYEEALREGRYRLRGHETYVRVQCTDKYGKTAWSNALFV